jgi:PIN domain nuclease of toxin-antitoxin system
MTAGLLLDTCAIIWIALDQPIDSAVKSRVNSVAFGDASLRVSPISAWELGLLSAKGRLPTTRSPAALFDEVLETRGVKVEALTPSVLIQSSFLPGKIHADPADRILIATARHAGLTIVTRDRTILKYAQDGHVRALAC